MISVLCKFIRSQLIDVEREIMNITSYISIYTLVYFLFIHAIKVVNDSNKINIGRNARGRTRRT